MACSLPGSSACGVFQARILEWVASPLSRGSFWPRDRTWLSCIAGRFFTIWATRKAKVEVFLEFPWFLYDPANVGNLISGSSASSKLSLYIWKFSVHRLLKTILKDFEHNLPSMWNEDNCTLVWTFFGIALLLDWNENWPFPVPWPLLSSPNSSVLFNLQIKSGS